jgi:O-antigen ligase
MAYIIAHLKKFFAILALASLALALLATVVFVTDQLELYADWQDAFENRVLVRSEEGELRSDVYRYGIELFSNNPISGIGYSNFASTFATVSTNKAIRAHNDYLESLVEMGVIGGIVYVSIVLYSGFSWFVLAKERRFRPYLVAFLLLSFYSLIRPMQMLIIWHLFLLLPVVIKRISNAPLQTRTDPC